MPPAPPTVNAVTGTRDQAGAPGRHGPAQAALGHHPGTAAPPRLGTRRDRLRCLVASLRGALMSSGGYYDPLFERPDLVEEDYYRFWNRPHAR